MIILGLTGSIGMGKSTTAQMFRDENIAVHDADKTVHQLYENEAVEPLRDLFPSAIVDGRVDRKALGRLVLGKRDKLKSLEQLIHPMVRQKEQQFLEKSKADNARLVVLDIPLLFETGGEKRVDVVLVVTADKEIQRQRVLEREDMSEEKFAAILKQQVPDSEKRQKADFIIDTGLGMDHARLEVRSIIKKLQSDT